MGFLLRENSILLKCYPTIKVFCGLAVKQRGPEVEITGFSFWLCHKFPLAELWASSFITACVTSAVPLLGYLVGGWICHPGKLLSPLWRDGTVSQTWRVCCVCAGGDGRASDVKISLYKLLGKRFSFAPRQGCVWCGRAFHVVCPEQCRALLWALLMVQMQPEISLSSSSPLRVKIQALT